MNTPAKNQATPSINRRAFVKTAALAGAGLAAVPVIARAAAKGGGKKSGAKAAKSNAPSPAAENLPATPANPNSPNILMIAIDDLRAWTNYLGFTQVKTPNMDRLAAMGTAMERAYCPAPICNPSRTALVTGLRPGTTGVYDNGADWRINKVASAVPTFPLWLRKHGYAAYAAGKIYHDVYRQASDWDEYPVTDKETSLPFAAERKGVGKIHWAPFATNSDSGMPDYRTANYCIEKLQQKHDKPFLIGCGFHKPHVQWHVPKKYFDMYPVDKIELPKVQPNLDGLPPIAQKLAQWGGEYEPMIKNGYWKEALQAYFACITYMDTQLGRVLDALEKSAYKDNTIVLLWVDHGWHHGEKHHWKKFALWEETTHVPVIWSVPGVTKPGSRCARTVDHMGIYPTLCDLAGVPLPPHLEGKSYRALLENPGAPWETPAITTYEANNNAIRTEKWRYIRYLDGSEELYDHDADPLEWKNLASDPQYASVKEDLKKWIPKANVPAQILHKNREPESNLEEIALAAVK